MRARPPKRGSVSCCMPLPSRIAHAAAGLAEHFWSLPRSLRQPARNARRAKPSQIGLAAEPCCNLRDSSFPPLRQFLLHWAFPDVLPTHQEPLQHSAEALERPQPQGQSVRLGSGCGSQRPPRVCPRAARGSDGAIGIAQQRRAGRRQGAGGVAWSWDWRGRGSKDGVWQVGLQGLQHAPVVGGAGSQQE